MGDERIRTRFVEDYIHDKVAQTGIMLDKSND
jgi:hypothetical protein